MQDSLQLKRLGEQYAEQGDYESAELLLRKALSIDEMLIPQTVALAEDLYNLGLLCEVLDKHSDAKNFLTRAWMIERSLLGDLHSETLSTFNALSETLYEPADAISRNGRLYTPTGVTTNGSHRYH